MKLKKIMRGKVAMFHGYVNQNIRAVTQKYAVRLKIRQKIDFANRWCEQHPRKFMWIAIGCTLLFSTSMIMTAFFFPHDEFAMQGLTEVLDQSEEVSDVFTGMRKIQAESMSQQMYFVKMKRQGVKLQHKIDSLRNLPVITAKDSLLILDKSKQLQSIQSIISPDEKD